MEVIQHSKIKKKHNIEREEESMPKVKVNDISIYYEVHGEEEPLLLIMGLGFDLTSWMFQTPEFSKKYQVIVFDNRGIGRTDAPDMPYSTEMMAGYVG